MTADHLPGTAGRIAAALGESLIRADMYSDLGGPVYHRFCADDTQEVRELVAALRGTDGPVLELACGSGRLTLPLLAAGHRVTGVDTSRSLLAELTGRLSAPGAARLAARFTPVEADMLGLALDGPFAAAVLGTTTIGLVPPEQRPELFAAVRRHLAPGAPFVLTVHVPEAAGPAGQPAETVSTMVLEDSVCTFVEYVAADRTRRHTAILQTRRDLPPVLLTSLVHVVGVAELGAELAAAGFAVQPARPVRRRDGSADPAHLIVLARSLP